MPHANLNGANVYYEIDGEGEPLVFLHAGISDTRLWDGQFDYYARQFRTLRYDLRGYGKTTAAAANFSHSDDLRVLLDQLSIERAILVGCSMGGTAAMDFLLTHPNRVSALVMICSTPSGYPFRGEPSPLVQKLISAHQQGDLETMADLAVQIWLVGENRRPEQVDEKLRALVYETSLIGFKNQMAGLGEEQQIVPPASERLSEIRVPTLIIDGAEDSPAIHEAGEFMQEQIARAQRVVIQDTAHLPSLELPDEFNRILTEFLTNALKQSHKE